MNRTDEKRRASPPPARMADRGVTEIVGVVLLLGITLLGTSVILLYGGDALDRNEKAVEVGQAEHALVQFDARASRVAFGESSVQQVDLGVRGSAGTLDVRPDAGWMQIERSNASNGQSRVISNSTLGALVYEHGETTVAYQGGGVWRSDGDGSVMRSRPEVHYRNKTLSIPVIQTRGEPGVYSGLEVTRGAPSVEEYPNASADLTNKVDDASIVITVQSEYYRAWGRFFEREMNAIVSYDHEAETVQVEFLAMPASFTPRNGVIATSGPGKLELLGTGAYVDSYNSSEGDYNATASRNGSVESVGDVNISADAEIAGDVRSGRYVDIHSSSGTIDGDVYWTEGFENKGTVTGTDTQIDGVASVPPIDGYVVDNVDRIRRDNDNENASVISQNELDGTSGTLESGDYYLENLDLEGQNLVLNTTDGDISIAVRDWVKLERSGGTGSTLEVEGDGRVEIFVEGREEVTVSVTGEGEREVNFHVGKGSQVHVPDERSTRLTVFGKQEFQATIAGSNGNPGDVDGVIYAPAGMTGSGDVYIKHAELYGAIVSGTLTLGQNGAVHFDYALKNTSLPLAPTVSRLEYLYVTTHGIHVDGSAPAANPMAISGSIELSGRPLHPDSPLATTLRPLDRPSGSGDL